MLKKLIFSILLLQTFPLFAQQNVYTTTKESTIEFGGYAEVYYAYSKDATDLKSNFLFNHKRNNQFAVNIAMINATYKEEKTRAKIGIMFGDYAQYNYDGEPNWAQFIYEANFGTLILKKHNIWLDAGVFPSHIGFETPLANDCWSATRSIVSENSPYYEAGVKLSHSSKNKKSTLALFYLNGWQKIIKPADISRPSFGLQYTYTPNDRFTINYSNYIGQCLSDSLKSTRIYNDIYLNYAISKKFGIIAGFDFGRDKYQLDKMDWWYAPIIIVRYNPNEKNHFSTRAEYFSDKNQIVIKNPINEQSSIFGYSINYDKNITDKTLFRIEYKHYNASTPFFERKYGMLMNNQDYFTAGFSVKL